MNGNGFGIAFSIHYVLLHEIQIHNISAFHIPNPSSRIQFAVLCIGDGFVRVNNRLIFKIEQSEQKIILSLELHYYVRRYFFIIIFYPFSQSLNIFAV